MNKLGTFGLLAIITIGLVAIVVHPVSSQAQIWTEDEQGNTRTDFGPEENVYIMGSGFVPNVLINLIITRPDTVENIFWENSDENGNFLYIYTLDGIVGTYSITATDGVENVAWIFDDCEIVLKTYVDPACAITETIFYQGNTVYAKATVLDSKKYYKFVWEDNTPGENVKVTIYENGATSRTDNYTLDNYPCPPIAPVGKWSLKLFEGKSSSGPWTLMRTNTFYVWHAIPPIADSWVENTNPNTNKGSDTTLYARVTWNGNKVTNLRRTYLKFDLSIIPPWMSITSAKLHMYVTSGANIPSVFSATDNWTENGITWNNQPSPGILQDNSGTVSGNWVEWDITNFAENEFEVDKLLTLVLKFNPENGSSLSTNFASREGTWNQRPWLEISVQPSRIQIKKVNEFSNLLGGATFKVTPNPYGGAYLLVTDGGTRDSDPTSGIFLLENVPHGNYTITENVAPTGYQLDNVPQLANVTCGLTVTLTFMDRLGKIQIRKVDESSNLLGGATFKVTPSPYGGAYLIVTDNIAPDSNSTPGIILLENVPLGNYTITENVAPTGYQLDNVPQTANVTSSATVTSTFTNRLGNISGAKWNDQSYNGIWDPGEPGLPDWTIQLYFFNQAENRWINIDNENTGAGGSYTFSRLLAGNYRVNEVLKSNWIQTYPASPGSYAITLSAGENRNGINFGNVSAVHGVSISISPSYENGPNGATLTYTVTVTNTGNASDTFLLTPTDNAGWSPSILPNSLALSPGSSGNATLSVTIPSNAIGGSKDNLTVEVADNGVNASASCTAQVTIAKGVNVSISPTSKSGLNGATLTYTVTVANTGNVPDTYNLTATNTAGWSENLSPTSLTIPAFSSANATLSVTIPANAAGGTIDNVTVSATGTGVSGSGSCTGQVTIAKGVNATISPSSQSGSNGATLAYTVTVSNTGNVSDTYNLTATNTAGWSENVSPTSLAVPAFSSANATLNVKVPTNAIGGTIDNVTVTAADNGVSGSSNCTAQVTTTKGVNVSISPSSQNGSNGATLTYTVTVANTGNVSDTYNLTATNTAGWSENLSPTSLAVPPWENRTSTLSVKVPSNAIGGTIDNITVTATDNGVSGSGNCTAQVTITKGVNVTISPSSQSGANGVTLNYTVTINNIGNVSDTYNLTATNTAGWSENVSPASLAVPALSSENATLSVTVPSNAIGGTIDNITVTATDNGVNASASCTAQVTIAKGVNVSISPTSKSGLNGATLTYTVTVANTGNVPDTYNLTATNTAGWSENLSPTSLTIPAFSSANATLSVTIPANAAGGTIDNVTVSATGTGVSGSGSCTGQVTIAKGVNATISPSSQSGSNGATLAYTVTVSNTGNVSDTYNLTATNTAGWSENVSPTSLAVPAFSSANATLNVKVPTNAIGGTIDNVTVTAADNGVSGSSNCTAQVTITKGVNVAISPSSKSGTNGATLTYTVTVANTGNVSDTYNLTATDNAGWSPSVQSPVTVPAFSSDNTKTLSVTIQPGAIGGTIDNLTVTATDNGVSSSGSCTANVTITRGVSVSISPGYQGGFNGTDISYTVTVVNLGNVTDIYDLKISDNLGWNKQLDDNALQVGRLDNENTTTLRVHVPENAVYCTRDNVTVTATSRTDNTVKDNGSCVAHAAAIIVVDVSISPILDNGLYKDVIVTNMGNIVDSYDLIISENVSWPLVLAETSVDNLMPGENRVIPLGITIPAYTTSGTMGGITVTATSKVYPTVKDNTSAQVTAIKGVKVSISPIENWGSPGDRLVYIVTVKNIGNTWDNYCLSKADIMGWTVAENFAWIPLAPGDNASVIIDVTIPENVAPYSADTINVAATSTTEPQINDNAIGKAFGPNLLVGWNLVCFTGAGENDTPNNLFSDMTYIRDYVVYWWEAPGGPYHLQAPGEAFKDNLGYWISTDKDEVYRTTGAEPASRDINLIAGWNLVGFPITNETTTPNKIFSGLTYFTDYFIYHWSAPGGPYALMNPGGVFENVLGYWVWINRDMTVTVP